MNYPTHTLHPNSLTNNICIMVIIGGCKLGYSMGRFMVQVLDVGILQWYHDF